MAAQRSSSSATLDEVITAYLQTAEEGQVPDHRELLQRYPQYADALGQFLETDLKIRQSTFGWQQQPEDPDLLQNGLPMETHWGSTNCLKKSPGVAWALSTRPDKLNLIALSL